MLFVWLRALIFVALGVVGGMNSLHAQGNFISPEVHGDRTVTFRLLAPRAETVSVEGVAGVKSQPMTLGENGVWTVTVGPL
jgi:enterochelin esterase family protein